VKATAVAHPIQGLIKYHGLKDAKLRIPFHDSISVCLEALCTTTTVETETALMRDRVEINGQMVTGAELGRVKVVLGRLRALTGYSGCFKVCSRNSVTTGKGLGFSASGFAALGVAASAALGVSVDYVALSEAVRLGAGSATRSLAGGFAVWFADKGGRSYAESIVGSERVDLGMVVVPVFSAVKTDEAHAEVLGSPLFAARLKYVKRIVRDMERAIREGDVAAIGELAEQDSLNLHASTMTGKAHLVLWEGGTIRVIREVEKMRRDGVDAWFSMDTGPSVFVNTYASNVGKVAAHLRRLGGLSVIESGVGGKPFLLDKHLF
jgi:diphosphomevalonate decarboxylase